MSNNRERKNDLRLLVNDQELQIIHENMERLDISNRSSYLRKMALDGYVIRVDTKPVTDIARLVKNAANNINQIARRANESGSVYESDVAQLRGEVDALIPLVIEVCSNVVNMNKN